MDIEKLLAGRKEIKGDDGMSPSTGRKKPRVVAEIEIPEGAEMPTGGGKRKLPMEKPETKEQATMMKKGGYVSAADGCAKRGKTKGRMV